MLLQLDPHFDKTMLWRDVGDVDARYASGCARACGWFHPNDKSAVRDRAPGRVDLEEHLQVIEQSADGTGQRPRLLRAAAGSTLRQNRAPAPARGSGRIGPRAGVLRADAGPGHVALQLDPPTDKTGQRAIEGPGCVDFEEHHQLIERGARCPR